MAYVSNTDPAIKRLQAQGTSTGGANAPSAPKASTNTYVSDTDPAIKRLRGESVYTPSVDPLMDAVSKPAVTTTDVKPQATPNLNINAFGAGDTSGGAKLMGNIFGAAGTGIAASAVETAGQLTQPQGLTIGENARLAAQGKGTQEEIAKAEKAKADRIRENIQKPLYETSDKLQAKSQQLTENAKEGLDSVGQFLVDASITGAQLAGDVALGAINPVLGTGAMATRVFGSSAQEARQAGATESQQQIYGLASAATSILVEKVAQVGNLFKRAYGGSIAGGSVDDILNKVIGKVVKNPTAQRAIASALGEGGEEALEAIIQPALQAIYDKGESLNKTWFTDNSEEAKEYLAEVGYNALLGGVLGAIGGGNANAPVETTTEAQNTTPNATAPRVEGEGDSNTPAAQNATEGVTRGYRGDVPQNIESPHIGRLEMSSAPYNPDGANLGGVYGNRYRSDVTKRATERLGIEKNKPAYLAAPNITKDGREYYVDVTPSSLKKLLSTKTNERLEVERLLLVDNLEKAIDNSYWAESNGDRKNRDQIDGFDTLRTSFYVDGIPYYADIKVKVVRSGNDSSAQNVAYFLEPEEIVGIKKADAPPPTTGRPAPHIFFKDNASSIGTTVAQPTENVNSVGAAHPSQLPFSHAETLYGMLPESARPVRPDDVPASVDGVNRVSESIPTIKGAAVTPDWFVPVLEENVLKGKYSTVRITNNETVQKCIEALSRKTEQEAIDDWIKATTGRITQDVVVTGQLLYNNAVQKGDKKTAERIIGEYVEMGTDTARALQAMSIMQKLSPETRLRFIKRSIRRMVEDANIDFDFENDARFNELAEQYENAENNEVADAILDEISKYVALQIPPSAKKIWDTLRYTNMLGNFKTQVRNTVGNTGMYAVSGVKNATAALIQRLTGANKTRSLVVDPAYRNAAKADFKNVEKVIARQGKYQEGSVDGDVFKQSVMDNTRVNTTKSKVLNYALTPLQKYSDVTQWLMNNKWFGDSAFARGNYARALGGYMKAQGITPEQWNDPKWQEDNGAKVQAVREFAINDALENTFRDSNWLSDWVSRIGRRKDTPGFGKALAEGLLPFRRTPANILLRAEEYSPLGLINTAVKAVQKAKGSEDVTANDVTEQLAKSLTGTALFGLGMLGAALGFLRGAEDKDEEQAAFDDLTGHQPYSIEIDGKSYTLDWLTPASMPLFMGVEVMNAIAENGLSLKGLETALTSIADPMLEMSMMSGMSDAIDSVQYAENNTMQFAVESALNYLTQGLTNTLLGQIERTTEENRMTTYIDKNSDVPTWLQYQLGKASAKTPGWDYQQTEYVDAWGRTESGGTAAQRAFNNFLAPWYSSTISNDPLEAELQRVANVTGENILPGRPEKYFNVDGERINLTAEQYTKYATTRGNEMYDLMQSVVNSSAYKKMSNAEKAEALNRAEEYATKVAKSEVSNYELDGWAAKAKNSGIAPAKYISVLSQLDKTNKGSPNVTQEEAQAALDATSLSRAEKAKMWNNINKNWKTNPYK